MASSNPPTTIRFRIGGRRTRGEAACRMRIHCLLDTSDREAHSSLLRNMIFKNPIRSLRSAPDIVVVESARAFSARVYFQNLCVGTISNNHFMSKFVVGLKTYAANAVRQGRLRKTSFNKAKPLKFNSKSRDCHRRSRPLHAHVRTFYPYARKKHRQLSAYRSSCKTACEQPTSFAPSQKTFCSTPASRFGSEQK